MSVSGQVYSLTLDKGHWVFKLKSSFSQNLLCYLKPNTILKLMRAQEWKIYTIGIGHMTKMAARPKYGKNP